MLERRGRLLYNACRRLLRGKRISVAEASITEQSPVEVPLYTSLDVARYLRASVWLVAMARGRFPPHPEIFFHWIERRLPYSLWEEAIPEIPELGERWSFRQLADLYVRLFVVDSLREIGRDNPEENGRVKVFSEVLWSILREHHRVPVFFGGAATEEGVAHVLQSCCTRLNEEERSRVEKRLLLCLSRIDTEGTSPSRLYPFSRSPPEGSPRTILIDPRVRFGRPTNAKHGIPTDMVFERHQAGDSIVELADDYGVDAAEIEEAIRYEGALHSPLLPFLAGW